MRERLGGELLRRLSMVQNGVDGILLTLPGTWGRALEVYFVKGGGCFPAILDLIRVMGVISDFGMTFDVEDQLLRKLIKALTL
jgi:hypothetical protein